MNKALTHNQLESLQEFVGYGRPDADIWFLLMEESGGEEEHVRARLKHEQVEDISKAATVPGRKAMSELLLRLDGKNPTEHDIESFDGEHLGKPHGPTLICTLIPIPAPKTEQTYANLLAEFETHQAFREAVLPDRVEMFQSLITEYHPKVVVACDLAFKEDYLQIFEQFKINEQGEFLIGWDTDTVVIVSGQLETLSEQGRMGELVTLIQENALSIDTGIHSAVPQLSEAELKRQKRAATREAANARRKPSTVHDPSDPYCVCAYCLKYEGTK